MRTLLRFLINNAFYVIFLILELLCVALIVNFNDFQKSIYFNTSNAVVGKLFEIETSIVQYFHLKRDNEQLTVDNARLIQQVLSLEEQLRTSTEGDSLQYDLSPEYYHLVTARVVNNTTKKARNYLTLNKGALDSVKPDMGVISDYGIVGITAAVSDNYTLVISVLNSRTRISARIKKSGYAGYLIWDGVDHRYANLEDISDYVPVEKNDTIVTTGFTSGFPENIPIGVVESLTLPAGSPYYNVKVRLFTNFKTITSVNIIKDRRQEERIQIEEENEQ